MPRVGIPVFCYAGFTLADPRPKLAYDVVEGKSGRNHPTSHQNPIHIGGMARNAYVGVSWNEGVVPYLVGTVKESNEYLLQLSVVLYTFGSRSAGDFLLTPEARNQPSHKLRPKWFGLFKIIERIGSNAYRLASSPRSSPI